MRNAKRRELVTSAAAIAFGASLDEPVERILAAADEPQVPTRVRAGDVVHLRSATETLITLYNRAGGGAVHHQALAALRWATAMRKSSCTPTVRVELAVTTADLADIAAWFTFDAGQHEPARELSPLGLQAARESGDLGMRANVASGLARQEIRRGNWAAGLDLTQLALTAPSLQPWSRENSPNVMCDLVLGGADVGDRTAHQVALIERFSTAFQQCPPGRTLSTASIAARLATLLYLEGEQHTAHQTANEAINLAGQLRSAGLAHDLRILRRAVPTGNGGDQALDPHHRVSVVLAEMT